MKTLTRLVVITILVTALHLTFYQLHSQAAVPHLINYQGRLTDTNSVALNGSYDLTFRLYDAENAGNLLWEGTHSGVTVSKGIFNILLGDVNNTGHNFANLAFDKTYWLEIKIKDPQTSSEEVMSPRQKLTAAGYALRAEKAESVDGVVKATGGLTIETRTSDPTSPVTGQLWLRTDL